MSIAMLPDRVDLRSASASVALIRLESIQEDK